MVRGDVMKLAESLHKKTSLNAEHIYDWLMEVGKDKGINPTKLDLISGDGIVFVRNERDYNCLECADRIFRRGRFARAFGGDSEGAYYWENRILARQEAWMD